MRRSTIIALLLLAALGGLYWYTNQEDNAISGALAGTPTPSLTAPQYLVEPFSKTVTRLEIRLAQEDRQLALDFSEGAWSAHNAETALEPVDQAAATAAVMNIQELRILSEIESPASLTDFGLQPAVTAEIKADFSDGTNLSLQIGKMTPTGSGYYVLDESQPGLVMVLPGFNLQNLLDLPVNPPLVEVMDVTPEGMETP
jgi:hypothetical protein